MASTTSSAQGGKRPSRGQQIVASTLRAQKSTESGSSGKPFGAQDSGVHKSTAECNNTRHQPVHHKSRMTQHQKKLYMLPRADCALAAGSRFMLHSEVSSHRLHLGRSRSRSSGGASGRFRWLSQSTSHSQLFMLQQKP